MGPGLRLRKRTAGICREGDPAAMTSSPSAGPPAFAEPYDVCGSVGRSVRRGTRTIGNWRPSSSAASK